MNGKIESIQPNYSGELIGKIIADDGSNYQFNRYNLADKTKSLEEFDVGEEVQFKLFINPKTNITYANSVKSIHDASSVFAVTHSHGDFKKFMFVNTNRVVEALKRMDLAPDFDCSLSPEKMISYVYKQIANSYNSLNDRDFQFAVTDDKTETLQLPAGIKAANMSPIMLYCTKSEKATATGVPWYCERILCNGAFVGDTIFNLINLNWYTLYEDIIGFSSTAKNEELDSLLSAIDRRCADRDSALVWLKEGQISNSENADSLYVPTGYYQSEGEELYLLCSKKNGIKGYGWYYHCVTYANAPITVYDKSDWLLKWGSFYNHTAFTEMCRGLADQTLEETWSFEHGTPYGILKNYLKYTFAHQWTDGKISYSKDHCFAAFNTGLPDKSTYKYLYMLFEAVPSLEKNSTHFLYYCSQYRFIGITKAGAGGAGKTLTSNIFPLPTPPQYFKSRSDTVWDLDFNDNSQLCTPEYDDAHILIRRCDRLPLDFYRSCASYSPKFQGIVNASNSSDAEKYKQIRQFLLPIDENSADTETTNVYRGLVASLENKIEAAIRKLSWNWRAVVPCFNPERNEPCYLLPISFSDPSKPDRALIATINKFEQGSSYIIHTVVPLDWAYLDARLVCRPESEWLGTNILASEQGD